MLRLSLKVLAIGLLVLVGGALAVAADAPKIKVLLITGDDVKAHPWRECAEATREALVASKRFCVKVCEDPFILESQAALARYDVIVLAMYNATTPAITEKAQENLVAFVRDGKGFFVQHIASASFKEWKEFGKLCGRKWVFGTSGHGPRKPFEVKVVKKDHPITKGIENFEVDDELYAKLQGDEPIEVLMEAYSDWSKKVEPLLFTLPYGKGRVVYNTFGHDGKALRTPSVAKLIVQGVEWAATGKVAP